MIKLYTWCFYTLDGTRTYFLGLNEEKTIGKGITFPKWAEKPIYQWDAIAHKEDPENWIAASNPEKLSRKVISFIFEDTAYVKKVWDPFDG
jgi:hypothetical protein